MDFKETHRMTDNTTLMPILFVGHGSPENVLNENTWTTSLKEVAKKIPTPDAILIISAHWLSNSLKITSNPTPDLVYDFFGFPQPLYSVKYHCTSNTEISDLVATTLNSYQPIMDTHRGFDHGVWTVLYHMYPKGNVPIIQLSLSSKLDYKQTLELGATLSKLREQKILILGSGNIVHNLRQLQRIVDPPFDWALKFDTWVKEKLAHHKYQELTQVDGDIKDCFQLAHPTPDHYLPFLICCGAARKEDTVNYPFEGFQYASISMRNILWKYAV
jgi:4,5-DOPA dioxygenase extradiol